MRYYTNRMLAHEGRVYKPGDEITDLPGKGRLELWLKNNVIRQEINATPDSEQIAGQASAGNETGKRKPATRTATRQRQPPPKENPPFVPPAEPAGDQQQDGDPDADVS